MIFGFTPLDPIIVLFGTGYGLYLLSKNPARLIGWMPSALSFYFFIPFVTLMTFWQTIPLILTFRAIILGRIAIPRRARFLVTGLFCCFAAGALIGVFVGADPTRAILRSVYYIGIFALFAFAYEFTRSDVGYELFLKGLVVTGFILAMYGIYQILAFYLGLPLRGILRGTGAAGIAFEAGLLRINSFANEPKRLGYVLFLCAMACPFYAAFKSERPKKAGWIGMFILMTSFLTFAGSYFVALAFFGATALILYPSRGSFYLCGLGVLLVCSWFANPDWAFFYAIEHGIERRLQEVEIGLDGVVVYRQEFYGWDYLKNNPVTVFLGTGLGQYYATLNQAYGVGVGFNSFGGLAPMNSLFLELILDFGIVVSVAFYAAIIRLIWKLRRIGETYLSLALLFLLCQSLTILVLHFLVFFAGVGSARLSLRSVQ